MATKKGNLQNTIRDLVLKGLDTVADRLGAPGDASAPRQKPVQKLAELWKSLDEDQRDRIATHVATVAESAAAAIPVAASAVAARAGKAMGRKATPEKKADAKTTVVAERVIIEPLAEADLPKKKKKKKDDKKDKKKDKDKKKKKKK